MKIGTGCTYSNTYIQYHTNISKCFREMCNQFLTASVSHTDSQILDRILFEIVWAVGGHIQHITY